MALTVVPAPAAAAPCLPLGPMVKDFTQRFGPYAVAAATRPNVARAAQRWGISRRGLNQLFEHTLFKKEARLRAIEREGGLAAGTLTDIFRQPGVASAEQTLIGLDALAQTIKASANHVWQRANGGMVRWVPSRLRIGNGLVLIEHDGRFQSVMPGALKDALRMRS